mgnify:CR=1 FL=1
MLAALQEVSVITLYFYHHNYANDELRALLIQKEFLFSGKLCPTIYSDDT